MKRFAGLVSFFFLCFYSLAFAGGPLNIACVSGFKTGLVGTPLTWANGQVNYYTDQGNLSTLLPSAAADQFVADAYARWTSISTAAIRADRAKVTEGPTDSGTNFVITKEKKCKTPQKLPIREQNPAVNRRPAEQALLQGSREFLPAGLVD
jgi:hypothetical protein